MKSVGETMAIGRTFKEALQKGLRSLEIDCFGLEYVNHTSREELRDLLKRPSHQRLFQIGEALRQNMSIETLYELTGVDPWFLGQIKEIIICEANLTREKIKDPPSLHGIKKMGFADRRISFLTGIKEEEIRKPLSPPVCPPGEKRKHRVRESRVTPCGAGAFFWCSSDQTDSTGIRGAAGPL